MTKYEHIVTVIGKRLSKDRDTNGDRYYEIILEDDLWDHSISVDLELGRNINIGDGITIVWEVL